MTLRYRWAAAATAVTLLLALLVLAPERARAASLRVVTDPTGDTRDPATKQPVNDPRSDALEASAEYRTDAIVLRIKAADPRNLKTDADFYPDPSEISWGIDTTGDFKLDYQVDYGLDAGELFAEVYPADAPPEAEAICQGTPRFIDGYYQATLDPNCLGSPDRFYFSAALLIFCRR